MTGKLRLPSLNALRVFHAVAQHKSIRQASDELLVTPQAVGQQIKLLEDTLQVTLFERKGRSIELTESAIILSHYVKAGFDEFAEGVRRVTKSTYRDRINLNASPYFATHYLLPRLSLFREILPGAVGTPEGTDVGGRPVPPTGVPMLGTAVGTDVGGCCCWRRCSKYFCGLA